MPDTMYLILVLGDVEPILYGPYTTDKSRLRRAKRLHMDDNGTLLRLNIDGEGRPEVEPFREAELPCPY
jgi:hypothetical protein